MNDVLKSLGIEPVSSGAAPGEWFPTKGPELVSENPANGEPLAAVRQAMAADYEAVADAAARAFRPGR